MIKIICVGKIKEKYLRQNVDDYIKRISRFTKIEVIEIQDEKTFEIALKKEGNNILQKINDNDYVITLDIGGESVSSVDFARKIDNIFLHKSVITFVIGGSYGLSNQVKDRSNYILSFSKMTFPHQLFRVILLEQIYRAYKINNNESYHK